MAGLLATPKPTTSLTPGSPTGNRYTWGGLGTAPTYETMNVTNGGQNVSWTPNPVYEDPNKAWATQWNQLNYESAAEDLRQKKMLGGMMAQGVAPIKGLTSASSLNTGDTTQGPSISAISSAIKQLQPQLPAQITPPTVPTAPVPAPTLADNSKAEALAYGQAKDKIGNEFAAASKGLRRNMMQRGISGTGIENQNQRALTQASLGALGSVSAQQAGQQVQRADDFSKLGYTGGIAQRGQDINSLLTRFGTEVGQRGQDVNAMIDPASYLLPLLALVKAGGTL